MGAGDSSKTARVLLFDLQSTGHHLENASGFLEALNRNGSLEVDFLAPWETEKHTEYFASSHLRTLFAKDSDATELYDPSTNDGQRAIMREAAEFIADSDYSLVHFLHVDFSSRWIYNSFRRLEDCPPFVGTLNGAYFVDRGLINQCIYSVLSTPLAPAIVPLLPDNPSRHVNLYKCFTTDVLDHLFVHSKAAKKHVLSMTGEYSSNDITVVPDPADLWCKDMPTQQEAREFFDIQQDERVVLFFGQLREEKGIDILLEAIKQYDGPEFTLIIAGVPKDVSTTELETGSDNPVVSLRTDLRFIPHEEIPMYYAVADGVVLPYRTMFGSKRTSNVFQNVCGAATPVIVPDFGTFSKRTNEYNLGIAYPPDSPAGLSDALERFMDDPKRTYDEQSIRSYATSQSYDALAETALERYHSLLNVKVKK